MITLASIDSTIADREAAYGGFKGQSRLAQSLKETVREHEGWKRLSPDKREAADMILHKIARAVNGNPDLFDTWHDIEGYAKLIADELEIAE